MGLSFLALWVRLTAPNQRAPAPPGQGAGEVASPPRPLDLPHRSDPDESQDLLHAFLQLVERPDLRDPVLDLAPWRVRRRGRVRQSLLSREGRADKSRARL